MATGGPSTKTVTPKGYPIEIFKEVNVKYLCALCNVTLKNPVQSFCGHRFCKDCLEYRIRSSHEENIICDQCKNEDAVSEYSQLKLDQTFPDNAIKREMMNCSVVCSFPGCDWSGPFKDYESHYLACEWMPVLCENCGKEIFRKEFDQHRCEKEEQKADGCPYGCGEKVDPNLDEHLVSGITKHFEIIHQKVCHLEKITGQRPGLPAGQNSLPDRIQILENNVSRLSSQATATPVQVPPPAGSESTGAGIGSSSEAMVAVATAAEKMAIYEGVITVLNREVEKLTLQMEAAERQRRLDRDQLDAFDRKVKSLERMVAMKDATIAELDLRITALEQTSYDGTLLWRIGDFQRRRQDAISGRTTSIYSPAFYTSRTGYKMCARIYLNGDGMGKGSHVSLFFVIMRGQYDALLKWPFRQKVTLMFLDQNNREHIVDAFRPDPTSSSFRRPTTEMNIASGCPLLMSLTQLDSSAHAYVKDNTAYVKIIVNTDDLVSS